MAIYLHFWGAAQTDTGPSHHIEGAGQSVLSDRGRFLVHRDRAPWQYDRVFYTKRNGIERLFPRPKGFRRIFSRFKKLDVPFLGFPNVARIIETRRECEHSLDSLRVPRSF